MSLLGKTYKQNEDGPGNKLQQGRTHLAQAQPKLNIKGPILTDFPMPVQPQVKEIYVSLSGRGLHECSSIARCRICPFGMAAPVLESWLGLGLHLAIFYTSTGLPREK